ncbi:MAG: neuraminidase-like domain-containing protein, partial [Nitrososphaera sp.]|nr:neuraminidase-like domain-containing protein [Nitrososphaera sp.]
MLHVIGRTFSEPHIYYYRKRMPDRTWTAWDKIDLSIEGDHVIPVVHQGRLMLFWPKFREVGSDDDKQWEISLAWSERNSNGWQAPRVGLGKLLLPFLAKSDLAFRLSSEHTDLGIGVFRQVHVQSRDETIPESYSVGVNRFVLNPCTGEVEVSANDPVLEFLHPDRVDAHGNRFIEEDSSGDQLLIAYGHIADDLVNIDPDTLHRLSQLLKEGGLGGVFLFVFMGGALILEQMRKARDQADYRPLLCSTPGQFTLVPNHQNAQFTAYQSFFCGMENRSYLVSPREQKTTEQSMEAVGLGGRGIFSGSRWLNGPQMELQGTFAIQWEFKKYQFESFYHPYFCEMVEQFNEFGVDGILNAPKVDVVLHRQLYKEPKTLQCNKLFPPNFNRKTTKFPCYQPTNNVWKQLDEPYDVYPYEQFDFSLDGAYSIYNWELFFHIPLLVADRLSKNQRFEEAQRWFHYIFDPTDVSIHPAPAKYWR